jgi:hypothetical protein
MPILRGVNKDFFKTWSCDMAYVLGFFAADGYITVNRRGGQYWCIHITDKELLEEIRKTVGSNHHIGVRPGQGNRQTTYRLQIGSVEMCDDLRKLGYAERKTKCLVIPNIPKRYFPDFVRGYFDGDGHVWTGHTHIHRPIKAFTLITGFTSGTLSFLKELKEMLAKEGLKGGSLITKARGFCLQYSREDSLKLYEIMYNSKAVNYLYLQRKKIVFERFLNKLRV